MTTANKIRAVVWLVPNATVGTCLIGGCQSHVTWIDKLFVSDDDALDECGDDTSLILDVKKADARSVACLLNKA